MIRRTKSITISHGGRLLGTPTYPSTFSKSVADKKGPMLSKTFSSFIGLVVILAGSLELSGCGTTQGDRALSGGLLGAGTGALIGSVTGFVGKGAVIGGLSGAALGALTSPDAINLGNPPWHHTSRYRHHYYASRSARASEACTTRETETQRITTCPKGK